jgi:hypothetical protein
LALAIVFLLASGPYPDALLELFRFAGSAADRLDSRCRRRVDRWRRHRSNEQLRRQRRCRDPGEPAAPGGGPAGRRPATNRLGRTVSTALRELQERLSRAENDLNTHLQQRSQASEFQDRVEEIQARQNALKLGEAVTKRKSLEQLFVEYQTTWVRRSSEPCPTSIATSREIPSTRIGSRRSSPRESRFRDLEQSSQMPIRGAAGPPHAAEGRARRHQSHDPAHRLEAQLGASIGALERDGDISLSERIKRITENRQGLSQRVANLAEELSVDDSHKDINSLFVRLSNELAFRASAMAAEEEYKAPPISGLRSSLRSHSCGMHSDVGACRKRARVEPVQDMRPERRPSGIGG